MRVRRNERRHLVNDFTKRLGTVALKSTGRKWTTACFHRTFRPENVLSRSACWECTSASRESIESRYFGGWTSTAFRWRTSESILCTRRSGAWLNTKLLLPASVRGRGAQEFMFSQHKHK